MTPPPLMTCVRTVASGGFSWSRFGPTVPVVLAAASVWQLPHFALKIAAPFVPGDRHGLDEAVLPRVRGDELGHVGEILALHEVRRHVGLKQVRRFPGGVLAGRPDLSRHDVADRGLLEAVRTCLRERRVEIRSDRPRGLSGRKCVAAAAVLLEHREAVLSAAPFNGPSCPAGCKHEGQSHPDCGGYQGAQQGYAGGLSVDFTCASASSRVG